MLEVRNEIQMTESDKAIVVERHCIECGKAYEVYPVYRGRPSQWYCSDECEGKYAQKIRQFGVSEPGREDTEKVKRLVENIESSYVSGKKDGYMDGFKDAIEFMIDQYFTD